MSPFSKNRLYPTVCAGYSSLRTMLACIKDVMEGVHAK